jgi:flagellar basal-body rod protein FlgF
MSHGIYKALRGAVALEKSLDVVADNVSNASTSGFRGRKVAFAEVMVATAHGDERTVRSDLGAVDPTAGAMRNTGRPLDVAIEGPGYFVLDTPQGPRLTRNGALSINSEGALVGSGGHLVLGKDGGPIVLPEASSTPNIAPDGAVSVGTDALGSLWVANPSPDAMEAEGAWFRPSAPLAPAGEGGHRLVSGALESSNVNVIQGMLDLIRVTRTYESLTRAIEMENELDTRTARGG